MEQNYYDILEVSKNASPEIIEKAYKTLVKKYHPDLQKSEDKNKYEEKIKKINEAYDILSDSEKRKNYDLNLKNTEVSINDYNILYQENINLKNNLNILSYSEKATTSSRKHSEDMMIKNYFDHTNKENKSPFDRMEEEGINYKNAGENIAAGQSSAIYAHHAWMNSLGHRKNILGDYKYIGVGVIFGGYYNIYYTQNFYT